MRLIIWLLYVTVFIYNILDYHQTRLLVEHGAKEINPIINWIVNINGNWENALYFKLILLTILGIYLFYYLHIYKKRQT